MTGNKRIEFNKSNMSVLRRQKTLNKTRNLRSYQRVTPVCLSAKLKCLLISKRGDRQRHKEITMSGKT
jgi:hypothetical protein